MKNKWLRMLVCFVLVCGILVNISPIRAEASVVAAYIGVEAANVIISALLGLGVGFASYELAEPYLNDCKDFLTLNYDFVSDEDKIQVWSANPDATYSDAPYYVAQDLIEAVREWMFESETVTGGSVAKDGYSFFNTSELPVLPSSLPSGYPYLYITLDSGNNCTLWCSTEAAVSYDDSGYVDVTGWQNGYDVIPYSLWSTYWRLGNRLYSDTGELDLTYTSTTSSVKCWLLWSSFDSDPVTTLPVSVADSVSLIPYHIAPKDEDYAVAYPTWTGSTTAIPIPGTAIGEEEETLPAVPIGLGQTVGETIGLTQADVWAGTSTYADTKTEAGTDTEAGTTTGSLADIKTAIDALPGAITDSLTDKIVPSAPAASYAMELTDFFPFCLPYDMYEFLTILKSTPQAPVFTWPISVPAIGLYYEIQIDLSPWNDVAALFRKMELLAFCVGLAYVSREKFLRA